jgi:SAM-dependent methyltransferase
VTNHNEERTDFYTVKYASFGSDVATELRREVFGEDIGQQGWRTAVEQAEIAEFVGIGKASHVLDVCCGSGGPSLALVQRTGCRLNGIDRETAGITHAQAQASALRLSDRATFSLADCAGVLPFEDSSFDVVLCIDAISHLPNRFGTLREWTRLLRHRGRVVFTDNAVITVRLPRVSSIYAPPAASSYSCRRALTKRPSKPPASLCYDVKTVRPQWQRLELACAPRGFVMLLHSSRRKAPTDSRNGRGCMRSRQNWPRAIGCRVSFTLQKSSARRDPSR